MIVALSAPAVFGAAGFAVDYGYASYLKRSLDQAADTASLAASSQSAAAAGGGYTNTSNLTTYGVNTFKGNIAKLNVPLTLSQSSCPTPPTPPSAGNWCMTVSPNSTGGVVATTSYSYNVPTYFSSLVGIPTITIAGSATATANPVTYINYYILLDISQSMGIGATQGDMNNLYTRTTSAGNEGCVFGCHVIQANGKDIAINEQLAHLPPRITLRIDSAITAIQHIIADAQTAAGSAKNIRIGIYTMSDDPTLTGQQLNIIASPSNDYTTLSAQAATITLGGNTPNGYGDTNYGPQMTKFNALLPANGSGVTSTSPKNYVFIITDGMADVYVNNSCYYSHCGAAFDPANCAPLKAKATVGTIYTTYLPIWQNNDPSSKAYDSRYSNIVGNKVTSIPSNMQSCASDSTLYYEASDGPAIDAKMRALFASTLKTARLTQ